VPAADFFQIPLGLVHDIHWYHSHSVVWKSMNVVVDFAAEVVVVAAAAAVAMVLPCVEADHYSRE